MADGNGEMGQSTPPSFTPPSHRRRAAARPEEEAHRETPASFVPPARRRAHASSADVPPSFSPSSTNRAKQASQTSDRTEHASHGRHAQALPMETPVRQAPRRSSGSTRASLADRSLVQVTAAGTLAPTRVSVPSSPSPDAMNRFAATPVTRGRRRNPLRIALICLALITALLAMLIFGAWNWVDAKLGHEAWLTDTSDSSGATSWLLVGSDKRDNTAGVTGADDATVTGFRTDTLLILTRPKNGPSSLISVPRDSLVEVDGQYMKINSVAQVYGNKALTDEIEQITGQKIDHVAEIQFGGLKNVVDAVGGVNLCYDQDVDDAYSGLKWTAGCHDADGTTALAFSRMRYADAQGDFGRAARQRQVIAAVMKKTLDVATLVNPGRVIALANAGLSSLTVDEDTNPMTLVSMAMAFRDATADGGITGSLYWSNPDYYVDGVGSSVLLDDDANTALFNQLVNGRHAAGEVGTLAES